MSIRAARPEEWEAICELLASASLPTSDLDAASTSLFSVYCAGNLIHAAIALEPRDADNGMLRSLVVTPSARRDGLGQALVAHAENEARRLGLKHVYLLTDSAEQFFAKRGYARIDRAEAPDRVRAHEQFRTLCPASAALMRKALT